MSLSETEQALIRNLPRKVRRASPLVHCMTNLVVGNFTANVLLALGTSPAMVTAEEETEVFATIADALLINIGTIDTPQLRAMRNAVSGANRAGKPWVLDPITAGLPFRMEAAKELLKEKPAVIRGNASEIITLATLSTGSIKGIDSRAAPEEALASAKALAGDIGTIVAVSGETDYVTDGRKTLAIPGGHPLMTRVTGIGCALNAVIAAYIVVAEEPFIGTAAALHAFAVCGEKAAEYATGTGSFAVAFLDRLSQLETLPSPFLRA